MLGFFVIFYILITLLVGAISSRFVRSSKDYVLAGRRLPLFLASSALFATWFGSETLMGASSKFVEGGILAVIEDPFGAALCLSLVGLFFARPLYRMNILTFGDLYRNRFGKKIEFLSALFMIPSYFGWIAAQLVAMGIVINSLFGFEMYVGILLASIVVLIYTYVGGMWAISITDFVQTILIVVGLAVLVWDLKEKAGGFDTVLSNSQPGFFNFFPPFELKAVLAYIAAWITIGLGSIPQQDIFQRVMSSKSEKVAVYSSYLGAVMYLTVAFLPLLAGYFARKVYPDIAFGDSQMILPQVVLIHSSLLIQILFFGALLSAILSTASGAILAPATVLGENLIRPLLKDTAEARLLKVLRFSVLLVTAVSTVMALSQTNIYQLVADSSSISLVSLFVPLVSALFWKRSTATGAIFAMFWGTAAWIGFKFWGPDWLPASLLGLAISFIGQLIGTFFPVAKLEQKELL
ncbi:transporter, SSS family [Leptospira inadai serovar Lyme str. 10]|uniref:Transporter, SSS family n=2 Tax=Leptospira inadai serovar Lyme TaxID=293084 RepID=V6HT03_9LEPT|nr:sodium:solute symporter family protein [Leptospira inadai]EQA35789.1 transporter, SSS family [Leptospira inadai serovar Lyme str. 10]PNV76963.1 sodium:solute symporter [Leptospira inadai serovar Lyme]